MKSNFEKSLKYVLAWEGGYVNHPKDPGGPTNKGITQRVYDAWRKEKKLVPRSVVEITNAEVATIYRVQYWDRIRGDELPLGLDYAVFDYAVNSGTAKAIKSLQQCVGVKIDGALGAVTLAKIPDTQEDTIKALCEQRYAFVKKLSTFKTFGAGWTRRIMGSKIGVQVGDKGVIDIAYAMALNEKPPAVAKLDTVDGSFAKADSADQKITTEPQAVAQSASGLSFAGILSGNWIISGLQNLGEFAGFTKDQLEPLTDYAPWIKTAFGVCLAVSVLGSFALFLKSKREGSTS